MLTPMSELVVHTLYTVVAHDNTACDEHCPGYVDYGELLFIGKAETQTQGIILMFAEPDDDLIEEWETKQFYWSDWDMQFKKV
jgi:hypothetical protein